MSEMYFSTDSLTGYMTTHTKDMCEGESCALHNPSHHMKSWPINIRGPYKSFLVERICKHGVGHPDPDSLSWIIAQGHGDETLGIHGCCGCCSEPTQSSQ